MLSNLASFQHLLTLFRSLEISFEWIFSSNDRALELTSELVEKMNKLESFSIVGPFTTSKPLCNLLATLNKLPLFKALSLTPQDSSITEPELLEIIESIGKIKNLVEFRFYMSVLMYPSKLWPFEHFSDYTKIVPRIGETLTMLPKLKTVDIVLNGIGSNDAHSIFF